MQDVDHANLSLSQMFKRGLEQLETEHWDEAEEIYRSILARWPTAVEAHHFVGIALCQQGELEEAVVSYREALVWEPRSSSVHNNLGKTLHDLNRSAEALESIRRALALRPDFPEAYNNLGLVLVALNRPAEAMEAYRAALKLRPEFAKVWNNLGVIMRQLTQPAEAVKAYRRAVALDPNFAMAWNNLALVLKDVGQLDEALACFDKGLAICSESAAVQGSRLYTLAFHPDYDNHAIYREARLWNDRFAWPLSGDIQQRDNDPSPQRRLRIGYVSPDFRGHCHSLFTLPLFSNHDHQQFEIFCYSGVTEPDAVTARIQGHADVWRDISPLTDLETTELIRQDRVDILIDLPMHLTGNRLRVFARKPVPIQVTWLGYPGTTGLTAIDYRLTDPRLDPPDLADVKNASGTASGACTHTQSAVSSSQQSGCADQDTADSAIGIAPLAVPLVQVGTKEEYYSERSVRLPDTFWCYDPRGIEDSEDVLMPDPGPLPALAAGRVTFGCLNNFCKVTDAGLALWAPVLAAVPNSQLILLSPEGQHRERIAPALGVERHRVSFVPLQPRRQYLETYRRIDLCLDTIPYNGHTTSLDAMWMGVPVVTRVGRTVVGRAGLSQLHNLDLLELVAWSDEQFVEIAVEWAKHLDRLSRLRAELRGGWSVRR